MKFTDSSQQFICTLYISNLFSEPELSGIMELSESELSVGVEELMDSKIPEVKRHIYIYIHA